MIIPNESFWQVFKATNGALSTAEAIAIMNIAAQVPYKDRIVEYVGLNPQGTKSGMIVESSNIYYEFGSYHGKSAMSAVQGLKPGRFMLVDPIFEDEKILAEVLGNVFNKDKNIGVGLTADLSLNVIPQLKNLTYVFVDTGSHGDGLPMAEVKLLEDRMIQGGIIAFHDYKNQFTEVEGAYNYLVSTGKYEPIEINWQEIFDYVAEHNLEEGNNSWHLYPELPHPPNFVGALRRK